MDKLFKFLGKKEVPKTEFKESIQKQESEKIPENLGLIGNIRRYSPVHIRKLMFGIGLMYGLNYELDVANEYVEDKVWEYNSHHETKKRVMNSYKEMLGSEEYAKFEKFLESNTTVYLGEESYQENIQKIAEDFPITAEELVTLDDRVIKNNIDTLVHDENLVKTLSEIKAAEKQGMEAGISIIPVYNVSMLRDVKYVENMKKVLALGIEHTGSKPQIVTDSLQTSLQKISELGSNIRFDGGVLRYRDGKVEVNDSFPNIKQNLDNAYVNESLLYHLGHYSRSINKWDVFFSDQKNKAIFSILQHEGYSISSFTFLAYQTNGIDTFFQDEGNMKFLLTLAEHVKREDLNKEEVMSMINFATDYYTHGKFDSLENMIPDIIQATQGKQKISLDEMTTILGKVGVYQNIYLPLIDETPKEYRLEEAFFEDPALSYVRELGYHKKPPALLAAMTLREQASWIMQTCRFMQTIGAKCTDSVFNTSLQSLMETRSSPEILEMKIFSGRNVAIMGHNEKYSTTAVSSDTTGESIHHRVKTVDVDRFVKDSMIVGIKNQHPENMKVFKASEDLKDLVSKKNEFINFIKTSKNVTIFIDAHGSPEAVSFSEGLPNNVGQVQGQEFSNSVYYSEIGEALIARYRAGIKDRPILIDNACMNFDFIQNLYRYIYYYNDGHNEKVPLPIAVGMSEKGQYGFSSFESSYGSMFAENLLKGAEGRKLNMGDVLDVERSGRGMLSNVSVFIPHTIEIQRFIYKEDASAKKKVVSAKTSKGPSSANSSINTTGTKPEEESKFELKKFKVEKPFQIAENEDVNKEEQEEFLG